MDTLSNKEKQKDTLLGYMNKIIRNFDERQREIGLAINEAEEFNSEQ